MKSKLSIILVLLALVFANFYFSKTNPDKLTQNKLQYFSLDGSSRFLGRLNLWYWFANQNDWVNAAKFETSLDQIRIFKLNNQPQLLSKKIDELENKNYKDVQDYLILAKMQSTLGQDKKAIQSISKAYQIDPIRPNLSQLYYSLIK